MKKLDQHKNALLYLLAGAQIIERAYQQVRKQKRFPDENTMCNRSQAHGESFLIQTPGKQHVMITSKTLIRELGQAPPGQLSLHAVAKEVRIPTEVIWRMFVDGLYIQFLQPRHTMAGFDWRNQRGWDGTVFIRALRSLGTVNLPKILPHIESGIADQIGRELEGLRCIHGSDRVNTWGIGEDLTAKGCQSVSVVAMVKSAVGRAGCIAFFGAEFGQIEAFCA